MKRRVLILLAALGLPAAFPCAAQFLYSETFKNTTAPGWSFAGDDPGTPAPVLTAAQGIDPAGDGWLRLTQNTGNQSAYAFFDSAVQTPGSIHVSFEYAVWNGSGADGISFFLFDGSTVSPSPGAFGGSLGYAQKTGVDGVVNGWLGVGLDNWGNFSNPTEGRIGGPGFIPNSVTVRGSGNGQNGYLYLTSANLDSIAQMDFPSSTTRPDQTGVDYRRVAIDISTNNLLTVTMQFGAAGTPLAVINNYDLAGSTNMVARPSTLGLGFSAATGGSTEIHEIRNFVLETSLPLVPELSSWIIAGVGLVAVAGTRFLVLRAKPVAAA